MVVEAGRGDGARADFLFVTGATGHTGSRAVARLLAEGHRVRCLVRTDESAAHLPLHEGLEKAAGDLEQADALADAMRGASAVLHLAHVGFAERVLFACAKAGVNRLICLSSTRRFTKFPEASAERVIAGERAIGKSALNYTILRPAMIYGGARDNNVEKIAQWLRRHSWMPLVRGGFNLVQPLLVDDLVEAIVRALARPRETGRRALTLAGPEPMSWKEMVETVAREMERPLTWVPIPYPLALAAAALAELKPGRPLATRDQVRRLLEDRAFDIGEARDALGGWQPRPFVDGVRLKLAGLDLSVGDV